MGESPSPRKSAGPTRTRYAVVGTGARAELFVRALAVDFADTAELVALADTNLTRMAVHNADLAALGAKPVAAHHASEFDRMLDEQQVDTVVVTTADHAHEHYVVRALEAGRDVITEKPMTVDAASCARILEARERSGRQVTVAFNYRFRPAHEKVREVVASGRIGEVGSVHFEWLLDLRHGADYFRRWHRDKANSGGLMVHKSSHHFDLVNWWIDARPRQVFGLGRLFFYGEENGRRHGVARDYARAHGSAAAEGDPFALRLADSPVLKRLYLDAEHEDGYRRDLNVFSPGISIEDDMAVVVGYDTGASLTYHLTAYSPWEGYRVAINGSRGRLELEVAENTWVGREPDPAGSSAVLHGAEEAPESSWSRLLVRPFWGPPEEIELPPGGAGHGGADGRMLAEIFGVDRHELGRPDPLGRRSSERDGALALLTGLAANRSFETGAAVDVAELLGGGLPAKP